jgi:hypothetical protein
MLAERRRDFIPPFYTLSRLACATMTGQHADMAMKSRTPVHGNMTGKISA